LAKQQGYHNVLWLDARENQYIEECGTMNVFFVIDGTVITPPLGGTILPGITRNSALQLLRENGYKVEVRPISIYELQSAWREGRVQEAFGVGTAATISHIARIGFNGEDITLPPVSERRVGNWLNQTMNRLKSGDLSDPYGWIYKV
ncbi:MAG: aminotransferase class IV, partial [Bacteroidota bacterium]